MISKEYKKALQELVKERDELGQEVNDLKDNITAICQEHKAKIKEIFNYISDLKFFDQNQKFAQEVILTKIKSKFLKEADKQ